MTGTVTALSPQHAVCRLTVVGPDGLVELALPVGVPVVRLIPGLVRCVAGGRAGEWGLRRIGGALLGAGDTARSLGLRDGEVLHLSC